LRTRSDRPGTTGPVLRCDGDRTVSAVVETVATEYDASPEAVEEDVLAFLEEMIQENLLIQEALA
jgi:hypothetical protein